MSELISEALPLLVSAILGGGMAAGIATLIKARSDARTGDAQVKAVEAKLPVEVDSFVVQGAESAVLTMKSALESAQHRISELEQDRAEDRRRIAELEQKVEELRRKVETAERALGEARQAGTDLRRELESFARDRDLRRP